MKQWVQKETKIYDRQVSTGKREIGTEGPMDKI